MVLSKIIYCFIKQGIEIKYYIKKLNRGKYKKLIIYYIFKQLSNLCVSITMHDIKISKYVTNLKYIKHLTYKIFT